MLITLLPPTAGQAWVAGHEITGDASGVRRNIGYVPQMVSADGALTGLENLRLSARLYHLPARRARGTHRRIARLHGPQRRRATAWCGRTRAA